MFVGYVDRNGYGYTFDGKSINRKLCNEEGGLIIGENEKILGKIEIEYNLTRGSRFCSTILLYDQLGLLYRTNQRFVCVREPKAWESVMKKGFTLPTPEGIANAWRTREAARAGAKEYLETPLSEITQCKQVWGGGVTVDIKCGNEKYHLGLTVPKVQIENIYPLFRDIIKLK